MRRLAVPIVAAVTLVTMLAVAPGNRASATNSRGLAASSCPGPEPLITARTTWKHHRLATGVTLAQTTVHDKTGKLDISVVRADLNSPNVEVKPLHRSIASRQVLSGLAKHAHLVAASNGMYFSFAYDAPVVPFINHGSPLVLSTVPQPVAGINVDNLAQDGNVWLDGAVNTEGGVVPLAAVNEVAPPPGLTLYTSAWGTHKVPLPAGSLSRAVVDGQILTHWTTPRQVPPGGRLLVANGEDAVDFLASLPRPSSLTASLHVETDAPIGFSQAYGTGTEVVVAPGQVQDDLYCDSSEVRAARTTIAWHGNGSHLMIVTVESPKGSENHGLDENQMSEVLVALGASRAYALDGGGSTELVARLHQQKKLSLATVNAHGGQRAIPVGVGIYSD